MEILIPRSTSSWRADALKMLKGFNLNWLKNVTGGKINILVFLPENCQLCCCDMGGLSRVGHKIKYINI